MAAQNNHNPPKNFKNNTFSKASSYKSFQVLAGDDTQFKIENRVRPTWLQESSKPRPAAEGFAIYRNRAFQVLQNKAQR